MPPRLPQLTEAGFAMLAEVGDVVIVMGGVVVGVCTGGACWVQPAMKIPATMQRPRMIKMLFLVIMIYRRKFCNGCVKKCSLPEEFVMPVDF
jgi:hypothetical protein